MDKNEPPGAATLLDFISGIEAPQGYGTIYGNNQGKLPKPLTAMTVAEVIGAGPGWARACGSSAAGRYQFMNTTLKDLKKELGPRGTQLIDANLQDRLGFHHDIFMGRATVGDSLRQAPGAGVGIAARACRHQGRLAECLKGPVLLCRRRPQ